MGLTKGFSSSSSSSSAVALAGSFLYYIGMPIRPCQANTAVFTYVPQAPQQVSGAQGVFWLCFTGIPGHQAIVARDNIMVASYISGSHSLLRLVVDLFKPIPVGTVTGHSYLGCLNVIADHLPP